MKRSDLNEGYGIVVNYNNDKRIMFVVGKQVSEHCAITYNPKENNYSFTVIGTGLSIGIDRFKTINKAMNSEKHLWFEEQCESEKMKSNIKSGKAFYKDLIKQKKFVEDFER